MEIKDRDAQERKIAEALATLSAAHREQLIRYLGTPPDINRVPDEFWRECEVETKKQLAALLLLLFLHSGQGLVAQIGAERIPGTLRTIDQTAAQWAEQEAERTAKQVSATTVERVRGAVGKYYDELDPNAFKDRIDGIYGEGRAAGIARDKTTNAQTAGQEAVRQGAAAEGVTMVAFWNSSKDSDVCPLCRPLHGKPESVWSREAPNGPGEEFHHGCRCFLDYKPGTDAQATPWVPESIMPDLGKPLTQLLHEGWVTLKPNGDTEGGYAHVFVGDGGKIEKGPAGLAAKGIDNVKQFGKGYLDAKAKYKAAKAAHAEDPSAANEDALAKAKKSMFDSGAEEAASKEKAKEKPKAKAKPEKKPEPAKPSPKESSDKGKAETAAIKAKMDAAKAAGLAKAKAEDAAKAAATGDKSKKLGDAVTKAQAEFAATPSDDQDAKLKAHGKLLQAKLAHGKYLSDMANQAEAAEGGPKSFQPLAAHVAGSGKGKGGKAEDWHAAEKTAYGIPASNPDPEAAEELRDKIIAKNVESQKTLAFYKSPEAEKQGLKKAAWEKYKNLNSEIEQMQAQYETLTVNDSFDRGPDGSLTTIPILEKDGKVQRAKFDAIQKSQGDGAAESREFIETYQTNAGYQDMNSALRSGKTTYESRNLSKAIETHGKLDKPIMVYRGIHGAPAEDFIASAEKALAEGGHVEMKGFVSTSTSGSVPIKHFGSKQGSGTLLVMRAKNGLLIHKGVGDDIGEDEFLQNHGVKYRPVRISRNVNVREDNGDHFGPTFTVIEMEQI